MPLDPPVITAVFPSSNFISVKFWGQIYDFI
jgi:hypothetical protein